jgi:hypothetical protein
MQRDKTLSPEVYQRSVQRFRVYDNGGETADRYTVTFVNIPESRGTVYALAANAAPYHPQGFGQHVSATPGRHLGALVATSTLPRDVLRFIASELRAICEAYDEEPIYTV